MPEHTVQSLGLTRIWTGLGPRDFAYRGHGYSVEPGTNRYWRLRALGGEQIATASTRREILNHLGRILDGGGPTTGPPDVTIRPLTKPIITLHLPEVADA